MKRVLVLGGFAVVAACSTEPTRQFTVTVVPTPAEGGTVTGGGRFAVGSTVTLTAQPKPPYVFGGWRRDDRIPASLSATYTFVDSVDHKFEALFLAPFRADVIEPIQYTPVAETVNLRLMAVSPRSVASVRAEVGGKRVDLSRNTALGDWRASIDISGMPLDTFAIAIVVTDVAGDTAISLLRLLHDRPPAIDVVLPLNETIARPGIAYAATCRDDFPGCTISVTDVNTFPLDPPALASGRGSIAGTVSLAAHEGRPVSLLFHARDSRFQTTVVARTVYVESSRQLDSIGNVPSTFLDVDATRALFRSADGSSVTLRRWGTGIDQLIPTTGLIGGAGLTPYGAAVSLFGSGRPARWIDWRNGVFTEQPGAVTSVVGRYALVRRSKGTTLTDSIFRYDLDTRLDAFVAESPYGATAVLSANGDVIMSGLAAGLRRYRDGTLAPLPGEPPSALSDSLPLVSGNTVVYRKTSPGISGKTYQLAMNDGTAEILLGPPRFQTSQSSSAILPGQDYDVNNGWVAFTQSDESTQRRIWLRAPTGELRPISPSGSVAFISALGPDGTVLFTVGMRRFLCPPGAAPRDVSGSHGTVRWFNGQPYLILGYTFWRIR